MSALDMGITAPCPFCGCRDAPDIVEDGSEVYAFCEDCLAQGPPTRIGCRDEDEDGPFDLEKEALELWNDRGPKAVTVEAVYDLCPALEASLAALESKEPTVRAVREKLEAAITNIGDRAKRLKVDLTPKELALFEKRKRPDG